MTNNSNQTGALLILALVLGAAVYVFMFFGSNMEQTNVSASFGHLSKNNSVNLFTSSKSKNTSEFSAKEKHSDLSGAALPISELKSTSSGDYSQTLNVDFPTSGMEQSDVQNQTRTSTNLKTGNYARNQSQTFAFGNTDVQYISNLQNPTKTDISALFLLNSRSAEAALTTQQGSKRATPALAAKTASVSTSLTDKSAKKVGGDPGDPGASLPVGDGLWIMLFCAASYCILKFSRFALEAAIQSF
ncbi:MAG: hypothetical protein WCJ61_13380 [Paludibacter sp.]